MYVRPQLAVRLIPILATIASWFGGALDITLHDENKQLIEKTEDDTQIHWVRLHGFSKWRG